MHMYIYTLHIACLVVIIHIFNNLLGYFKDSSLACPDPNLQVAEEEYSPQLELYLDKLVDTQ